MSLHVRSGSRPQIGSLAAALVVLVATACDHASTSPGSGSIQFSRRISLPDAQSLLQTGLARVDVGLIPGTLVARRVAIETTDELARPEEVRSRINAISATADQGTVTLELGGLKVGFNSSTQFRPDDGDSDEHDARRFCGARAGRPRGRGASGGEGASRSPRHAAGPGRRDLSRYRAQARPG